MIFPSLISDGFRFKLLVWRPCSLRTSSLEGIGSQGLVSRPVCREATGFKGVSFDEPHVLE